MRNAIQFDFQRNCDLLLDLFGRVSRPLRDDLRVGVGNVGIRLNREIVKRDDAPHEQHQRTTQHHQAVSQSKIDHGADHYCFDSAFFSATSVENSSALATTSSPGFTPSRISCMPSGASPSACTATLRKRLSASLRKTQSLSCKRMIAVAGTTVRACSFLERKLATANIPGRSAPSELPNTMRTFADLVFGSSTRAISATLPWNTRLENAFRRMSAESPT